MKVRYTPRTIADIEDIHTYMADRNPQAAIAVVTRIKQAIESLGDFPGVGRMTERGNVRILPVGRYPYLIFYRVDAAADESCDPSCAARRKAASGSTHQVTLESVIAASPFTSPASHPISTRYRSAISAG